MLRMSPLAHIGNVVTPTLFLVGALDRRVPPAQSYEYYYALRQRGVNAVMCVFADCDHALAKPAAEENQWINGVLFCRRILAPVSTASGATAAP